VITSVARMEKRNLFAAAREQRIVAACKVEFPCEGRLASGISQDLSRNGIFVRTRDFLPIGEVVELTIHLPNGPTLPVTSRVAHTLPEVSARALSRFPGMGFAFAEEGSRRQELDRYIDDLVSSLTPQVGAELQSTRILLADASPRLLERLSTALGGVGFIVSTASNGAEAYASCLHNPPSLLLTGVDMPVMDAWTLIETLGTRPDLAQIPVVLMSEEAGDIARLRAYRAGVRDFIPKPFTVAEVCIRLTWLARAQRVGSERVVLRGSLRELGLATLLSLLEFERKTGVLAVMREGEIVWISVDGGQVVKVCASAGPAPSMQNLMQVLDWTEGNFEFVNCPVYDSDEIGKSITHVLLEHARRSDEQAAGG
jgi:CheY-like chemotaxis protein/Tfp pilus assembly protein PilZ